MSDALDFEELAAYIEGRLDEPRRARMAARLARDPEAYELFAASLRAVDEEAAEGGAEVVVHPASRQRWVIGALAAVLVLALALVFFLRAMSTEQLISELEAERVAILPEHSTQTLRWFESGTIYRGDSASLETARLAGRMGIGVIDLAAAKAAGDDEATAMIVARMQYEARVGGRVEVGSLIAAYAEIRHQPDVLDALEEGLAGAFAGTDTRARFALGRWAEAGRLASLIDDPMVGHWRFWWARPKPARDDLERAVIEEALAKARAAVKNDGDVRAAFEALVKRVGG